MKFVFRIPFFFRHTITCIFLICDSDCYKYLEVHIFRCRIVILTTFLNLFRMAIGTSRCFGDRIRTFTLEIIEDAHKETYRHNKTDP